MANQDEWKQAVGDLSNAVRLTENHSSADADNPNVPQSEDDCYCTRCCAIRLLALLETSTLITFIDDP